jgi:hypothetical protein
MILQQMSAFAFGETTSYSVAEVSSFLQNFMLQQLHVLITLFHMVG